MSDIPKTARKENPVGVMQEKSQTYAEGVATSVEGAPENISIQEYVDRRFEQQTAENGQARAEMHLDLEKVRSENGELRGKTRTEFAELNAKMDTGFAEMDAKVDKGFAEVDAKMDKGFAEIRAENKDSQSHQLRWIVGTIIAVGILVAATGFFT